MNQTLLTLYFSFVKIGFSSFGGLSMIPLIRDEMLGHGWMTAAEVTDIVAIAEMTPGPLGFNCATFAGIRTAGVPGALAANLGVLTPAFTTALLAAVFFERFRKNRTVKRALVGIRPAVIGMVAGIIMTLSLTNYVLPAGGLDWKALCISLGAFVLLQKFRFSVPKVILCCAAAGLLISLACGGAAA